MKTFKIEKCVPITSLKKEKKKKVKKVKPDKYPFKDMMVGDSFFVKANNTFIGKEVSDNWYRNYYINKTYNNIRYYANKFIKSMIGQGPKLSFTIRKVKGGFRCWRTK